MIRIIQTLHRRLGSDHSAAKTSRLPSWPTNELINNLRGSSANAHDNGTECGKHLSSKEADEHAARVQTRDYPLATRQNVVRWSNDQVIGRNFSVLPAIRAGILEERLGVLFAFFVSFLDHYVWRFI